MTLLRWLTFILGSPTVILKDWNYLFLLTLEFVLRGLYVDWENLIMLLSQFQLTYLQTQTGILLFIAELMTNFVLIQMIVVII